MRKQNRHKYENENMRSKTTIKHQIKVNDPIKTKPTREYAKQTRPSNEN